MLNRIALSSLVLAFAAAPSFAADPRDARIALQIDITIAKFTLRQGRTFFYEPESNRIPDAKQNSPKSTANPSSTRESQPDKPNENRPAEFNPREVEKLVKTLRSSAEPHRLQPAPLVADNRSMPPANWELSVMEFRKGIRLSAGAYAFELDIELRLP
jgi:hypothetical protein